MLAPEKSKQDAESNYQRNQLMGCIETKVVIPAQCICKLNMPIWYVRRKMGREGFGMNGMHANLSLYGHMRTKLLRTNLCDEVLVGWAYSEFPMFILVLYKDDGPYRGET